MNQKKKTFMYQIVSSADLQRQAQSRHLGFGTAFVAGIMLAITVAVPAQSPRADSGSPPTTSAVPGHVQSGPAIDLRMSNRLRLASLQ